MPKVLVTVEHGTTNQRHDAMSVWIKNVTASQFEVCLRESTSFDGPHSDIAVVGTVINHSFQSKMINIFHFSLIFRL